ncbi:IclR family transcriptional regulator domain-containing protein [Kineosporia babensis]|uniref:IclR-ED domain-containing protein n=1 Tax=Kineosporia babensis TaxID=499548 RepID=A0A9X1NGP3_9ACTN|nr:IclR family transcriptional regulator C-terminal domain-containing protein [Kineosporia babensis]MCD5314707.1 hypothetical protein [Kineosporia babensis]
MLVGTLARELGASLSRTSRLCSELLELGLLAHGDAYGSYGLGPLAVRLSGRAAAPFAHTLRYALTLAAHQTGETVCLAARSGGTLRITATVDSLWTLHAQADPGDLIEDATSGIAQADQRPGSFEDDEVFESAIGSCSEIAAPILSPEGEHLAVLAVRMPVNRLPQHGPQARSAVRSARRRIQDAVLALPDLGSAPTVASDSSLGAAVQILWHLAAQPDSIAGTARAVGLRADRTQRLLASCERAGLVSSNPGRSQFRIGWAVHAWHRSVVTPTLAQLGSPLVARTAELTETCGFVTVLRGMRSLTLVEHLSRPGTGLRMAPWLGRAHPIIGSDGGPVLVMDLELPQIAELFPPRYTRLELDRFLRRVRQVVRDGAISMEPFDDTGMQSVAAPVRDASGAVAAAACLVATTEHFAVHGERLETAVRQLADRLSGLLGHG